MLQTIISKICVRFANITSYNSLYLQYKISWELYTEKIRGHIMNNLL